MTIIYCDLCGESLAKGDSGNKIIVSEFRAESCDRCAKELIKFVKSGPWKSGASSK